MSDDVPSSPEQVESLAVVNTWFAARGFRLTRSPIDYAEMVRSSPWGKRAPSRDLHAWVDLARLDGTVVSAGYGAGTTFTEAAERARRRWLEEQEASPPDAARR